MKLLYMVLSFATVCSAADLTGNWVVAVPNADGTARRTYLNLKQEASGITGTIRVTQFFYRIAESKGGPDGFTVIGTMKDGNSDRRVTYEGKLVGDDLHLTTRRNATAPPTEMIAHRAAAGEGALPARLPLPALHKVRDNGLARTPPMGWNSWNKFAGRVDDATVRGVADAMAGNGMRDSGYVYINIDDTWEAERDAQGNIQTNKKFPDMKALADYVHSKGLKIGIYSSPGPNTCAGYEGTYGHEEQDARTYAAWGIDYSNTTGAASARCTRTKKCRRFTRKWATHCWQPGGRLCTAFVNMGARTSGNGGRTSVATCGEPPAISAMPGIP